MPGFVPPQLASLRSKPPAGDNWLHEIKYDGYRLQVHLDKGRVTIRTRTGLDWTKRFSAIAAAFDIPVDRAIFDGEVVAVKDDRTNFSELQAALAAGRQEALTFNVFDLLFLEGFDLRDSPLSERKRILKELFGGDGSIGPYPVRRPSYVGRAALVRARMQAGVRRDHLEKSRRPVPVGTQRRVGQDQVRAAGEVSGCGIREGSDGGRGTSPR
jgi:ATP-dependent DNA ligase